MQIITVRDRLLSLIHIYYAVLANGAAIRDVRTGECLYREGMGEEQDVYKRQMFNSEAELVAAGVPAFRIYYAAFFCMGFQFVGQSVFVALGRSKNAVFFSLLRKAFIVAPLTLILPVLGLGYNGVFLAEPISNVIGGLACLITMYVTVYRPLGTKTDN